MISKKIKKYMDEQKSKYSSFRKFIGACRTESTKASYSRSLRQFIEFAKKKGYVENAGDYDSLLKLETDKITDLLEEWVVELSGRVSVPTVGVSLCGPELFFEMNRKIWHKKTVRRGVGGDERERIKDEPIITEEINTLLLATKSPHNKAAVHFFASTGIRPGALTDPVIRMKHLVEICDVKKNKCRGVKIYANSREEYWAFLTPEANAALERYINSRKINGEEITAESPVFLSKNKTPLNDRNLRQIVIRLMKTSGMKREKNGKKYNKAVIYMFRKRFNGIMKMNNDVNYNIAEKLMGHKRGLDGTYLKPTMEECFKEFEKVIEDLTIDPANRQKILLKKQESEITKLHEEKKELETREEEIQNMLKRIEFLERSRKIQSEA